MTTMNCLRRLTQECLRFKGRLLLGAIALISLAVTRLYLTWLIKLWVEGPLENGEAGAVRWLITVGLLGTGCMVIAIFLSRYLLNDVNQRMLQGLRNQMQERLLKMRVADVWRFQSGDLISRIFNDIDNLSFFVRDILERIIGEGIVAVCSIGIMFYLDWRLALIISGGGDHTDWSDQSHQAVRRKGALPLRLAQRNLYGTVAGDHNNQELPNRKFRAGSIHRSKHRLPSTRHALPPPIRRPSVGYLAYYGPCSFRHDLVR